MTVGTASGTPTGDDGFATFVAGEMTRITGARYRTTRHGGHARDRDESSADRSFWPGVDFSPTTVTDGPTLCTTFTLARDPRTFGFRVDLASAVERWDLRIGIVTAASRPALFAAEVCWYMVVQIGDADLDAIRVGGDGTYWVNSPTEVFGRLTVTAAR